VRHGLAARRRPQDMAPRQRLEEDLGLRLEPLPAIILPRQFDSEPEETRQVPRLGVDGALGLPGHLGSNVWLGERHQSSLRVTCHHRHNLLFKIMCWDEGTMWPRFSSVSGHYLSQRTRL
jgi:hypothetical protein